MPEYVSQLIREKELEGFIDPDSDKVKALAFLSADKNIGYRPSEIAARTEISESSVAETMKKLFSRKYVACINNYYFIPGNELDRVRRTLIDIHSRKYLIKNSNEEVTWEETESDNKREAEEIVDEVSTRSGTDKTTS